MVAVHRCFVSGALVESAGLDGGDGFIRICQFLRPSVTEGVGQKLSNLKFVFDSYVRISNHHFLSRTDRGMKLAGTRTQVGALSVAAGFGQDAVADVVANGRATH